MIYFVVILFLITLTRADGNISNNNNTRCNDFNSNFSVKKIKGSWFVVAIIPEKLFSDYLEQVTCYRVEFTETDVAGLRWLVNRTLKSSSKKDVVDHITGTIVRQRYHSVPPFDVWSKSVEGVTGCFQQVLSLYTDKRDIHQALPHDAMMQLHLMDASNGSTPLLLQILWGRMISVVIYSRNQDATEDQLQPVSDLMNKLRGLKTKPRICVPGIWKHD